MENSKEPCCPVPFTHGRELIHFRAYAVPPEVFSNAGSNPSFDLSRLVGSRLGLAFRKIGVNIRRGGVAQQAANRAPVPHITPGLPPSFTL